MKIPEVFERADSMLKLLVYAKIEHIKSANHITDMARYHEVYRLVSRC